MWKRSMLALLATLLAIALLELGLQVASLVVQRGTRGDLVSLWNRSGLRVLCLGDSNTYGIQVARDETWPSQLEAIWNKRREGPQIEVLNLGFPGTNSSRLVINFPDLLATLQPDLVIIMIGVNDFWTLPTPLPDAGPTTASFWKRHSKIYRAYYLLRRGRDVADVEIIMDPEASVSKGARYRARVGNREFEMGFRPAERGQQGHMRGLREKGHMRRLRENLESLATEAASARTRLVLMSYPARKDFYPLANNIIRRVAADLSTPLVNLTEVFILLCLDRKCPSYMLADEHHPNAEGYRVIAEALSDRLGSVLR